MREEKQFPRLGHFGKFFGGFLVLSLSVSLTLSLRLSLPITHSHTRTLACTHTLAGPHSHSLAISLESTEKGKKSNRCQLMRQKGCARRDLLGRI